jgi:hypothetical protein
MRTKYWVAVMVAKCANPSCSAPFRYLRDGRLFRLECDPASGSSQSNRAEYFWLCHACLLTMTLCLRADGTVMTIRLPEPIRDLPHGDAVISADREKGLLLRRIFTPHSRAWHGSNSSRQPLSA